MRALIVLTLLRAAAPLLHAEPGRTAASVLQRPLAARSAGMGEAFAAVDAGVDSLGYNPAGAARLARPELASSYNSGIAGDDFGFLGYAHPLSLATLTAGFVYYDAGSVNLSFSDGRQESRTAEKDMAALLGLGAPLGWGLCIGGTAKVFRLELAEEVKAAGYAADLGALWHTPLKGLNLGVSLQNLGPDVKFEEEGDPLPQTIRFGAAYGFNLDNLDWFREGGLGFSRFLFTADAVKARDENDVLPSAGLEMGIPWGAQSYGALRAGYMF